MAAGDLAAAVAAGAPLVTIGTLRPRERAVVRARVASVVVVPVAGGDGAWLAVTVTDGTGSMCLRFNGRRAVPGLSPGQEVIAGGTARLDGGVLAIWDPWYRLVAGATGT